MPRVVRLLDDREFLDALEVREGEFSCLLYARDPESRDAVEPKGPAIALALDDPHKAAVARNRTLEPIGDNRRIALRPEAPVLISIRWIAQNAGPDILVSLRVAVGNNDAALSVP